MNAKAIRILCFTLFLTFSHLNVQAQKVNVVYKPSNFDYEYTLKMAQNAYEASNFGEAIRLAEIAKKERKEVSAWEAYILQQTQKNFLVRKAGDLLEDVIPVLESKNYIDAKNVVEKYISERGKSFFNNKFSEVQNWIIANNQYPEADFIIGRIYRLEGEYSFAKKYLDEAYSSAILLDVPDVKYDILYELAELSKSQGNMEEYEKNLQLVLKDDKLYRDKRFMDALIRFVDLNKADSVEKFFLLYRSDNDISISALGKLNQYYDKIGKQEEALRCISLACIASVTKIEEILKDRLIDYTYVDLPDLLLKASLYSDILAWGNENKIWEMFYNLAKTAEKQNKLIYSQTLFKILADYEPEPYWQKRAEYSIR